MTKTPPVITISQDDKAVLQMITGIKTKYRKLALEQVLPHATNIMLRWDVPTRFQNINPLESLPSYDSIDVSHEDAKIIIDAKNKNRSLSSLISPATKYPDLKVKGLEWYPMGDTMTAYDPLFEKQVICTDIEQYEKERSQRILDTIDMPILENLCDE